MPSKVRLTVVIPTLNEAHYLPCLLTALATQTRPPDEVIVADAGSGDGTPAIARQRGAAVVLGGVPSVGRNAGARAAQGDLLLFLDADVLPACDFIERLLAAFEQRGLDVATCLMEPLSDRFTDHLLHQAANVYLLAIRPLSPHAPGFCILTRRSIHEAIGGFDESLRMAEDHDYVRRAGRMGRFGVLTGVRLPVSVRRLDGEGLGPLAAKYLWVELQTLAGRPVHSLYFEYRFGQHTESGPAPRRSGRPALPWLVALIPDRSQMRGAVLSTANLLLPELASRFPPSSTLKAGWTKNPLNERE
jgi:glycosyltransferase involved in cell wall biosynthesis